MTNWPIPAPFGLALETVGAVWDVVDHVTGGLLGLAENLFDVTTQSLVGWVGYAFGAEPAQPFIGLFVQPACNAPALTTAIHVALATAGRIVPIKVIVVDRFRCAAGPPGPGGGGAGSIRPGESVLCTSNTCTGPVAGAISAILQPRKSPEEKWILGNHHVLARQLGCRFKMAGVKEDSFAIKAQATQTVIARETITHELSATAGNAFDACAAKLVTPTLAVADYPIPLTNGTPVVPNVNDMVRKKGPATGLTTGTVQFLSGRVRIDIESSGVFAAQLVGQILIGINQAGGASFFAEGDSGSLIVHTASGQPVGILVGGGVSDADHRQYTVVSPLGAILDGIDGIHPDGDTFDIWTGP